MVERCVAQQPIRIDAGTLVNDIDYRYCVLGISGIERKLMQLSLLETEIMKSVQRPKIENQSPYAQPCENRMLRVNNLDQGDFLTYDSVEALLDLHCQHLPDIKNSLILVKKQQFFISFFFSESKRGKNNKIYGTNDVAKRTSIKHDSTVGFPAHSVRYTVFEFKNSLKI